MELDQLYQQALEHNEYPEGRQGIGNNIGLGGRCISICCSNTGSSHNKKIKFIDLTSLYEFTVLEGLEIRNFGNIWVKLPSVQNLKVLSLSSNNLETL